MAMDIRKHPAKLAHDGMQMLLDSVNNVTFEMKQTLRSLGVNTKDTAETDPPLLTGHHPPSTRSRHDLQTITLDGLRKDTHHKGRIIYLRIYSVTVINGMTMIVQDARGAGALVWSLIAYPISGGEVSMISGTIIAVKEPYFGHSIRNELSICVHHPTDIERIPRFDLNARGLVPRLPPDFDLAKAERKAFKDGWMMEAVELCSEALSKTATREEAAPWYVKRAAAYARLKMCDKVIEDVRKALDHDKSNRRALKLLCDAALEVEDYSEAQQAAATLLSIAPDSDTTKDLTRKVLTKTAQANGFHDLGQLAKATTPQHIIHNNISNFVRNVEVRPRPSRPSERGLFAMQRIKRGEIVMWEKAIAVSSDEKLSSFDDGLSGLLDTDDSNGWRSRDSMAFLQKLGTTTSRSELSAMRLFGMHEGELEQRSGLNGQDQPAIFNSYVATKIISKFAAAIPRGVASTDLEFYDPNTRSKPSLAYRQFNNPHNGDLLVRAMWPRLSLISHFCMGNSGYAYIGNVAILTALRDMEKDEELTVAAARRDEPYEKRKQKMAKGGLRCECRICKIESSLSPFALKCREGMASGSKDMLSYPKHWGTRDTELAVFQVKFKAAMETYGTELHNRLPCIGLVEPLFRMAHAILGPVKHWSIQSDADLATARNYFLLSLMLGLRLYLVQDLKSSYWMVKYGEHAMSHSIGVLALVGLAQISYVSSRKLVERSRAANLLYCAREEYKVQYGEVATFDDHFEIYSCMRLAGNLGIFAVLPTGKHVRATVDEELRATNRA